MFTLDELLNYDPEKGLQGTPSAPLPSKSGWLSLNEILNYGENVSAPEPEEDRSLIDLAGQGLAHGTLGLGESVGTAIQWAGGRLGSEAIQEEGKIISGFWGEKAEEHAPPKEITGKNVWDDPELLKNASWWVYNVADMIPAFAAMLVPGTQAAKIGKAIQVGGKAVGFSAEVAEKLAKLGQYMPAGLVGGGLEGTQTYKQVLQEGGSEEEAARAMELMTAGAGILNALGIRGVLSKAGEGFRGKVIQKLGAGAWEGITEGAEEPTEVFSRYIAKYLTGAELPTDLSEQLIESLKDGLTVAPIAGVVGVGGAMVAGGAPTEDAVPPAPPIEDVPAALDQIRQDYEAGNITPEMMPALAQQHPELAEGLGELVAEQQRKTEIETRKADVSLKVKGGIARKNQARIDRQWQTEQDKLATEERERDALIEWEKAEEEAADEAYWQQEEQDILAQKKKKPVEEEVESELQAKIVAEAKESKKAAEFAKQPTPKIEVPETFMGAREGELEMPEPTFLDRARAGLEEKGESKESVKAKERKITAEEERIRKSPEGARLLKESLIQEEKDHPTPTAFQKLVGEISGKRFKLREQKLTQKEIEDNEFKDWAKKAESRKYTAEELAEAKRIVDRIDEDKAFREWYLKSQRPIEIEKPPEVTPEVEKEVKVKESHEMTLDEFEAAGHRPADVTKSQWVDIMRRHKRSLSQPEESGTAAAPYGDYEAYWERDKAALTEKPVEGEKGFNPLDILMKPSSEEKGGLEQKADTKIIDTHIQNVKTEIEDWQSRIYKKNKTVVAGGGTVDDLNSELTTIGAANERRRTKEIAWREKAIKRLEKAKVRIANGEDVQAVMSDMEDDGFAFDLTKMPKSTPTPAKPKKVEPRGAEEVVEAKKPKPGMVRIDKINKTVPFTAFHEFTKKGKNQGKVRITYQGRKYILEKSSIKSWPEGKEVELAPIVERALKETITDIGQVSPDERKSLNQAVKKGVLSKGRGGPFPTIKTEYAAPGYDFKGEREKAIAKITGKEPVVEEKVEPKGEKKGEEVLHSAKEIATVPPMTSKKGPGEIPTKKDLVSPEGGVIPGNYIKELETIIKNKVGGLPDDIAGLTEVVGKDGKPKIVHHGTAENVTDFKSGPQRTANRSVQGDNLYGTFFTDSESDAQFYSTGGFFEKPSKHSKIIDAHLDIRIPYKINTTDQLLNIYASHAEAKKDLMELGHDGLHIVPGKGKTEWWVPFSNDDIYVVRTNEIPNWKHNAITAIISTDGNINEAIRLLKGWRSSQKSIDFIEDLRDRFFPKPTRSPSEGEQSPKLSTKPLPTSIPIEELTAESLQAIPGVQRVKWSPLRKSYRLHFAGKRSVEIRAVTLEGKDSYNAETKLLVAGTYVNRQIEIVKGVGDKYTISHELEHFMENAGVIGLRERSALKKELKKGKSKNWKPAQGWVEARAEFVEEAMRNREQYRGTVIGKVLQKIADFIDALVVAFSGTQTARSVIRGIESGKIFDKKGEAKGVFGFAVEPQYATKEISPEEMARRYVESTLSDYLGTQVKAMPALKDAVEKTMVFEQSPGTTARASLVRHFNDVMYWIVDKNRPITMVQKRLDKVTDDVDVFLKETQRPKRTAAKVKKAWDSEIKPLIEKMSQHKVDVQTLELYKHALHAPEANEALRRSNAKGQVEKIIKILEIKDKATAKDIKKSVKDLESPKEWFVALNSIIKQHKEKESLQNTIEKWKAFSNKPSGMTDAESAEILKQHKGDRKIEELGRMLDSINDNSLQLLFDSGQLSAEEYEAISNKYEHYVPLYREGFDDQLFGGASRGLKPAGRPIKTRGGSTRNVVNILAHSISNYEKAINRAEKARSQRALRGLIEANPDQELVNIDPVKKSPRHDEHGNLRMYPDLFNVNDNEMRLMVGGKQYLVSVQRDNKDAMLMMRTLKAEDGMTGPIVNTLAKLNRFLARINTTWSPEFIVSNFARDFQTANINIQDTGVKGKGMLKGAAAAWKAIYASERGKARGTELEGYYGRFKAAGGKIGWSDVHGSVENLGKKITRELRMEAGKAPVRKRVTEWLQFIDDINTSIENGIRLHVFKLAVEQGKTDERAAQIASDLTVDFTKKGAAGPVINSLYLFANAGIQGSNRIARAAMKSRRVQATLVGIIGAGFAVGVLNALAGGEDDDGEDYFNKIDDYIRERNMIIMLPGTKGKYIKIPLPWGYNVFWNIGSEASRAFTKENYNALAGAGRLASTFADAFNPVASGTLLQTLAPTVADPFVQVAENKNWFGGDLMPERNKFDKTPDPDSQRYWKSAGTISKWVTLQLNSLTGGDKIKPGMIDVSPETLDLIVDTAGGSAFRFVKDTLGLPYKAVRREEIEMHKIPFVRRVAGEKPKWADSRIFYENIENVFIAKEQLKAYKGTPGYVKMKIALETEKSLIPEATESETKLRRLRKRLKRKRAQGNRAEVERLEGRINAVYIRFNKKYNMKMGK